MPYPISVVKSHGSNVCVIHIQLITGACSQRVHRQCKQRTMVYVISLQKIGWNQAKTTGWSKKTYTSTPLIRLSKDPYQLWQHLGKKGHPSNLELNFVSVHLERKMHWRNQRIRVKNWIASQPTAWNFALKFSVAYYYIVDGEASVHELYICVWPQRSQCKDL